jgi:hypothetical protein
MTDWGPCDLCGEQLTDDDVGEWVADDDGEHVMAHVNCAQMAGLEMA